MVKVFNGILRKAWICQRIAIQPFIWRRRQEAKSLPFQGRVVGFESHRRYQNMRKFPSGQRVQLVALRLMSFGSSNLSFLTKTLVYRLPKVSLSYDFSRSEWGVRDYSVAYVLGYRQENYLRTLI